MLVLTRRSQEKIRIGTNIFIQVVRIDGNKVRIGIEAPSDVKIVRSELIDDTSEIRRESVDLDRVQIRRPQRENRPA